MRYRKPRRFGKPQRRGTTRRMIRAALKPGRVKYPKAGKAHREAVTRAAKAALKLTKFDLRVLMGVTALTTAYSKRSDRMAVSQVAGYVFGIEPADVTGRQRDRVSESLRRLHNAGVLEYEPGRGRGAVALIGFPEPPEETHPKVGRDSGQETHHGSDRNTPKFEQKHTQTGGHTEKVSEEISEESFGDSSEPDSSRYPSGDTFTRERGKRPRSDGEGEESRARLCPDCGALNWLWGTGPIPCGCGS